MVNDILMHHGIKGQRWGVRRYQNPDGSLTAEGKKHYSSKYLIQQIDEQYEIADKSNKEEKNTVYKNHGIQLTKDGDIVIKRNNSNIKLRRVSSSNSEEELKRKFLYLSAGKYDEEIYSKFFDKDLLGTKNLNGEDKNLFVKKYKLKKDIKVASAETVIKTILQDKNLDRRFKYMKSIDDLYSKAKMDSLKGLFNTIDDERRYTKLQDDVQQLITYFDENPAKYSEKLHREGYDACIDIMDNLCADIPIVMFYPEDRIKLLERSN